jgi:hypothetical protein
MIPGKHKANAVLSIVLDQAKDSSQFYVEPYVNGREVGWCISMLMARRVAFSENRNSDSIVVYSGDVVDFSMQGNVPDENVYRNSVMFDHNAYLAAATFILRHLECEQEASK